MQNFHLFIAALLLLGSSVSKIRATNPKEMKSLTVQTQKPPASRRSREKPHQIVEKIVTPVVFPAPSELDSVDSSKLSISSPSESSDRIDPSDHSTAPSVADAIQESVGSDDCKAETLEVEVAVELLLGARRQVLDSPSVDARSKKLLDYLIRSAIEPLDQMGDKKVEVKEVVGAKVWISFLCLLICIVSFSIVMIRNGRSGTGVDGIPPPT